MREAFASSEGRTGINHNHAVTQRLCESRQGDSDMSGSHDYQRRWRWKTLDEDIKDKSTRRTLNCLGMCSRIPVPDRPLRIFHNQGIKRGKTQCTARALAWQDQQFRPYIL